MKSIKESAISYRAVYDVMKNLPDDLKTEAEDTMGAYQINGEKVNSEAKAATSTNIIAENEKATAENEKTTEEDRKVISQLPKDKIYFHREFYEGVKKLPLELRIEIEDAVLLYQFYGIKRNMSAVCAGIFEIVKPMLESDLRKKRVNKGGAPKGNQNARRIK